MTWWTRARRCRCSPRLSTKPRGKLILAVAQAGDKYSSRKSLPSSRAEVLNALTVAGIFLYTWENTVMVDL